MRRSMYLAILGAIAFLWLLLRFRAAIRSMALRTPGKPMLDLRPFGYDSQDVAAYLGALGQEGRRSYLRTLTRIELPFIIAYAILFGAAGMWLSAAISAQNWKLVSWLPFIGSFLIFGGALCDIDEGAALRKLIKTFPQSSEINVARASRNTRLKWLFLVLGISTLLIGAVVLAVAMLKSG
jgi:hypothetical protein